MNYELESMDNMLMRKPEEVLDSAAWYLIKEQSPLTPSRCQAMRLLSSLENVVRSTRSGTL